MKTATITLHSAHNNGSFLQAYALQKTIKSFGITNEIINYVPLAQNALYQNIVFKGIGIKPIIKGLLNITHYLGLKIRKERFNSLLKLLERTRLFKCEDDFPEVVAPFDILIAGSDQIWNIATMPDFTPLYLLPVSGYKVAYGPSFGKSMNHQFDNSDVIKLINDFNCLSVREKGAQKEIKKLTQRDDVEIVLDPTFLPDKSNYDEIENKSNCTQHGEYIFFYCIKASNEVLNTVRKISKALGLPVVTIFTGVTTYRCHVYGQKVDFSAGPSEFISYIKNSKYVISNSFHGVAFSIIYNKNFFRIADNDNGSAKIDERIDSLLDILGLNNQTIVAGSDFKLNKDINYDYSNKKIKMLRNRSTAWLKTALTKEQEN